MNTTCSSSDKHQKDGVVTSSGREDGSREVTLSLRQVDICARYNVVMVTTQEILVSVLALQSWKHKMNEFNYIIIICTLQCGLVII